MSNHPSASFEEYFEQQMKDPEFRAAYEALEPIYQLIRRRIDQGLTQEQLAEKAGVTLTTITRLESGTYKPSLKTLRRVAEVLGCKVVVRIVPQEE